MDIRPAVREVEGGESVLIMGIVYNYMKYRVAECVCFLLFCVRVEL